MSHGSLDDLAASRGGGGRAGASHPPSNDDPVLTGHRIVSGRTTATALPARCLLATALLEAIEQQALAGGVRVDARVGAYPAPRPGDDRRVTTAGIEGHL